MPQNPSVMVHSFSEVPRADIPRSSFNRSHGHKLTMDADDLVPIIIDDIIPGDTFNVNANFVARLASPTILPLMDNMYLETFFFFVPYRLLWDNWEKFCGARHDPIDSIDYTIPVCSGGTAISAHHVADYMGFPNAFSMNAFATASALPFRAYNLIWNEWFRDQNLQDSIDIPTDNGPDTEAESGAVAACLKRGKRHDYFTSCLPWPQKGNTVALPLGTLAPIAFQGANNDDIVIHDDIGADGAANWTLDTDGTAGGHLKADGPTGSLASNVYADLSAATAATINDLRLAFQTQRLLERDARSGTRYVETILAHYGVTVPDFRLQRPEFLGGGSSRLNISPVAQTTYQGTQTLEDSKGALGGVGVAVGSHGFTKSFVEHGVLIGLANVRGDITYGQGLERYWDKSTRYDFYYPVLSNIGEQSVLNREIWFQNAGDDDLVFGYQERYAEYRYKPSRLSGKMRVDHGTTLAAFHLSEDFAALPTLGSTFIQSNTAVPLDRAVSVPAEPQFVCDFYFNMKCARPMPLYGVPGNLDHF